MTSQKDRLNLLIWVDLEGISGVDNPIQVNPVSPQYQIYITEEANAAIGGFKRGGVEKFNVIDLHGYYPEPNIRSDLLDRDARLFTKDEILCQPWNTFMKDLGSIVDAAAFLGCHPRRQSQGFMSHTIQYNPPIYIKINDMEISETHLSVFWSGVHDFPVILFAGDDIAMMEAASLVPNAERVVTKKSLSRSSCELLPISIVLENIEEAAYRAVSRIDEIQSYNQPDEYRIEISFNSEKHAFACLSIPRAENKDSTTVTYTAGNYYEASSFIDVAIALASHYEDQILISELKKTECARNIMDDWEQRRCRIIGADWDSK